MRRCPVCAQENPEGFRFCGSCGAPLADGARHEVRKLATVLFCDIVGSTSLGERIDPETVRARLGETFDHLRGILERHGGTVEKFIGDAVMAVYGVPQAHEDDALRAVRAAVEMRDAVAAHGLEARIGVNSGEVVAGDGHTLVTGDAVNVAARLEQAAQPGEILIGTETLRLVPAAVTTEPAGPFELKGKAEAVDAHRLLAVDPTAAPMARQLDAPLVGRNAELATLSAAFERAIAERRCELVTVLGAPGVGKSRLAAEFVERARTKARVVQGRCLHYGDGITFWPLVEALMALGPEAEPVLEALAGGSGSSHELFWTVRKLLEQVAAEQPLVLVFDDLQWAEPTFLDLIDHVALLTADAPLLLLCLARPELLDTRPAWPATVRVEPLDDTEREQLIDSFLLGEPLDKGLRSRIAEASEGNPLFVEQMLAMVREDGGSVSVPPTIHALLEARLDGLAGEERAIVDRGSVEGEVFHRRPVAALLGTSEPIESRLFALVRKEVIRPTPPTFAEDDAFRFRHILLRDTAYAALPKAARAELHERFADWLEARPGRLLEHHEIVGYHLEQAHHYRAALDPADPRLPGLEQRAGRHLAAAGRVALGRGDWTAARSLVVRALALLPPDDPDRLETLPPLVRVGMEAGDFELVRGSLEELEQSASAQARSYAAVLRFDVEATTAGKAVEDVPAAVDEARRVFEAAGDERGLAYADRAEGFLGWFSCRAHDAAEAWERALVHADRAGEDEIADEMRSMLATALAHGPTPVELSLPRLKEMLEGARGRVLVEATIQRALGRVHAMRGEFEIARELMRAGIEAAREAGLAVMAASTAQGLSFVEQHAGDDAAAERVLRGAIEELDRLGDRGFISTTAIDLADLLYRHRRQEEARALTELARERTAPEDVVNIAFLDCLDARFLARDGDLSEAERRSLRGLALAETTDFPRVRSFAHQARAETLMLLGRHDEAADEGAQAISVFEEKGDLVAAARTRERLAALETEL